MPTFEAVNQIAYIFYKRVCGYIALANQKFMYDYD